jgi:hypothetical protein
MIFRDLPEGVVYSVGDPSGGKSHRGQVGMSGPFSPVDGKLKCRPVNSTLINQSSS